MGASGTDARLSGTEVLVVAASAAALLTVAKPGVGASATVAGASGTTPAAALGAIGLAEVAAPELPTSAVASAVAAEAPVAWTPADEPAAAEELLGQKTLANEEKKLFSKKQSTGNKGSEWKNTYPEPPGFQHPRRLGDHCCPGGGGGGGCCCCCCCRRRGEARSVGGGGSAATPGVPREPGAWELPWPASLAAL